MVKMYGFMLEVRLNMKICNKDFKELVTIIYNKLFMVYDSLSWISDRSELASNFLQN